MDVKYLILCVRTESMCSNVNLNIRFHPLLCAASLICSTRGGVGPFNVHGPAPVLYSPRDHSFITYGPGRGGGAGVQAPWVCQCIVVIVT